MIIRYTKAENMSTHLCSYVLYIHVCVCVFPCVCSGRDRLAARASLIAHSGNDARVVHLGEKIIGERTPWPKVATFQKHERQSNPLIKTHYGAVICGLIL